MPVLRITQTGEPVLRQRALEVPKARIKSPQVQQLIAAMVETMRDAPGVGLAAPQVGVPLRICVLEDPDEVVPGDDEVRERLAFGLKVFINPVLRPVGDEQVTHFEGCLSVTGFSALVPRWREVEVTGFDEKGKQRKWRVKGWPARILQHECDHLDGVLYLDRMHTRSFTNPRAAGHWAGKSVAEVKRLLGIE